MKSKIIFKFRIYNTERGLVSHGGAYWLKVETDDQLTDQPTEKRLFKKKNIFF